MRADSHVDAKNIENYDNVVIYQRACAPGIAELKKQIFDDDKNLYSQMLCLYSICTQAL